MHAAARAVGVVVFSAALAAGDALAQSCAMCASSFGENDPMARAISWSILFMMAAPYAIVGTVAAVLFYLHRRGHSRRFGMTEQGRLLRPAGEGDVK